MMILHVHGMIGNIIQKSWIHERYILSLGEWIKTLGTQTISNLDNYINIRMKIVIRNRRRILSLRNFLNTISDITSNQLLQSDLFTLDICLKIVRIPSKCLVHFLTEFELYRLSQLFLSLPSGDNQCITSNKIYKTQIETDFDAPPSIFPDLLFRPSLFQTMNSTLLIESINIICLSCTNSSTSAFFHVALHFFTLCNVYIHVLFLWSS